MDKVLFDPARLPAPDARGIAFKKFSLQDCRPKGVTDKLTAGHTDTRDTTNHTSDVMISQIYDRRTTKKGSPSK